MFYPCSALFMDSGDSSIWCHGCHHEMGDRNVIDRFCYVTGNLAAELNVALVILCFLIYHRIFANPWQWSNKNPPETLNLPRETVLPHISYLLPAFGSDAMQ